jgi:hypothetical protein
MLAVLQKNQRNLAAVAETSVQRAEPDPTSYAFPITTVSMKYNFDAYILVGFRGADPSTAPHLIVDSGNTSLVVPHWEDIAAIPDYQATYQILGRATEPWVCPANVVKGPIQLFDSTGGLFTIDDCIFFACTGDAPDHPHPHRTANFGTGCVMPWTASTGNVVANLGLTLQPVLSLTTYPFVEFDYAPMRPVEVADDAINASVDSVLRIHSVAPEGFAMFDVLRDCAWMALTPIGLSIAGSPTKWPGELAFPIAMIDTGGGPVYLSDPNNYLCSNDWPQPVANPAWAASSKLARSIQAPLEITLGDGTGSYRYVIDSSHFPAADQGLTLVMCDQSSFMMGQQGMNIGGISALANAILVDYKNGKVGFRKR